MARLKRLLSVADATAEHLSELETSGLAPTTLANARSFIGRFARVAAHEGRDRRKRSPFMMSEIDNRLVTRYFAMGTGEPGNFNQHRVHLNRFLLWAEATDCLAPGTALKLLHGRKSRKEVRQPKYYIPPSDFPAALDAAGSRHPADRAWMATAMFTLARKGEIAGITLGRLDLAASSVQIYRSKRKRWTEVGVCPELAGELPAWLDRYAFEMGYRTCSLMANEHPDWKLIPRTAALRERGPDGRYGDICGFTIDPELSPVEPENIVKRALDVTGAMDTETGLKVRHKGEGCHTIRRSGARALLDHLSQPHMLGQDRALLEVSVMLDHESTDITLLYIGYDQERERLNDWLRSNSMYGQAPRPPAGNVVRLSDRRNPIRDPDRKPAATRAYIRTAP